MTLGSTGVAPHAGRDTSRTTGVCSPVPSARKESRARVRLYRLSFDRVRRGARSRPFLRRPLLARLRVLDASRREAADRRPAPCLDCDAPRPCSRSPARSPSCSSGRRRPSQMLGPAGSSSARSKRASSGGRRNVRFAGRRSEPAFLVCPVCTTHLKEPCRACEAPLEPLWQVCPYCTAPVKAPALSISTLP